MKYLCFGYYDKDKFDGMTESERNAMFDTCFEYDDHLRSNGHWGGGEALQGPETALTLYWKNERLLNAPQHSGRGPSTSGTVMERVP